MINTKSVFQTMAVLIVVCHCCSNALCAESTYDGKPVDFWIGRLSSANSLEIIEARVALVKIGKPSAEALVPLINSANADVSAQAIRALAEFGEMANGAVPKIIGLMENPNEKIRFACATTLGALKSGGKEAMNSLVKALNDPSEMVQRASIQSILQFGVDAKDAAPALGKFLLSTDSELLAADCLATLEKWARLRQMLFPQLQEF